MELRILDKSIEPLGVIDELASLLWCMKYFDVGTFSLLAPITDNNSKLLVEGNIIVKHDKKPEITDANGGIWRRAAPDYLRAYYERRERVRADRGAGLYIEPLAGKTLHIPADSGNSHKPEFNKYYGNEKLRQRGSREKAV